jgi:putative CocE/NonD family hydrolase
MGDGRVVIDDLWVVVSDGCRLFGRVWRPANDAPAPAVLEAHPYGIGAGMIGAHVFHAFAEAGYAAVALELRGSGNSEGLPQDEYVEQELDDLVEAIAWLADQAWCSGAVGMMGVSWSGFNTLQVAARRPPALRAGISIGSTDDRYADDVHYSGGCLLANEVQGWSTIMLSVQGRPPDPAHVGDRWKDAWRERLAAVEPPVETWLSHQLRDAYWKHGSVCEDFSAINCPMLMIGGWEDGYPRGALRALAGLEQGWAILGPWGHSFPIDGIPGPRLAMAPIMRWWARWLRDEPNGEEHQPRLRAYIRGPRAPGPLPAEEPGRWVGVSAWPDAASVQMLALSRELLDQHIVGEDVAVRSPASTGTRSAVWCPYGSPAQSSGDQRPDDGQSTCFTSAPLHAAVDILGLPSVTLTLSADRPRASVAVRLCHVLPDGASRLLAVGARNLTHDDAHETARELVPGERQTVRVDLRAVAQHVPAGHRLRVAVSSSYWPWLWPPPDNVTLTIHLDGSNELILPVVPNSAFELPAQPAHDLPEPDNAIAEGRSTRTVSWDVATAVSTIHWVEDGGRHRDPVDGLESSYTYEQRYEIAEGDPLTARVHAIATAEYSRGDWRCVVRATGSMRADQTTFYLDGCVQGMHGDETISERTFTRLIARNHL